MEHSMQNNEFETNTPAKSNKDLALKITAVVLAICVLAAAVFFVVQTMRSDNPTNPTVDAAALAEAARNTVAITIGNRNLSAVELNYFYVEVINNFCNEYQQYIYYYGMIDTTKPLNEQYFDEEKKVTWADYFLDTAKNNIKSTYTLYDLAVAEGITLDQGQQDQLNLMKKSIEQTATNYKYASADAYMEDIFGYGADLNGYLAYCELAMIADAYYNQYANSLTYTADQLREFEGDKAHEYHSYTYATYYLQTSKFLTGGTEGSDGKITYTDEQKAAAITAATEAANGLKGTSCDSTDAFKELILNMDINSSLDSVSITTKEDLLYSGIDPMFQTWLVEKDRNFGDVTAIAKTSKGADEKEVIEGYYILWYGGFNENTMFMKDVRHILVMFKNKDGKTYSNGITSFTDEEKAEAKAAAEALLQQWKDGAATEDSFAALAKEKTEDTGSAANGGLYTNVYPGQMVEGFENWCYDPTRQHGDTGLVESVYGYHIMFFVSDSQQTYRDFMVAYAKRSADLKAWHDDLVSKAQLTVVSLDYCELDMKLSG